MIDHTLRFTVPAAYTLLPARMASPAATAMLLAIGLQESRFLRRRQVQGPARGFWQFERGGIAGVLKHPATVDYIRHALVQLRYEQEATNPSLCHVIVEDNDTLACVFARLLLWTVPADLPTRDAPDLAWSQYLAAWRPGKPHCGSWDALYAEAWSRVDTATLKGSL
jgi:hypothetical protein